MTSPSPSGVAVALEALREQRRAAHFYQLCDPSPSPPAAAPSIPPCSAHTVCAAARQHIHSEASSCLDAYIHSCAAAGLKPAAAVRHVGRCRCSWLAPGLLQPLRSSCRLPAGVCALRSKCEAEAAVFFRDALASEPCCIEAVPELLRLGAKEDDVRALLQVLTLILPHLPPPPPPPPSAEAEAAAGSPLSSLVQPITSQMPFIASWLRALSSQVPHPPTLPPTPPHP